MCQYSASGENFRDVRQGEDLVVSQAPHGASNWLTEPGKPECAVCIPNDAVLAIQLPNQGVRGAKFVQRQAASLDGHYDFLRFRDGDYELIPLDDIPRGTGVRALLVHQWSTSVIPPVPDSIGSNRHEEQEDILGEVQGAGFWDTIDETVLVSTSA